MIGLSRYRRQRNWGARILEYTYRGLALVILENELLRVGILAGKGADVIEFNYKPRDLDCVWLTPGGVRNPTDYLSTYPDPLATFLDYYPGGWQEIFPNGGSPTTVLGAQFGQHGEVANLPWDYVVTDDHEDEVAVRFSVRTQKMPFTLSKEFRLRAGEPSLVLSERLINESSIRLPAMWGYHLAYGHPFLRPGCRLHLPDGVTVIPHPEAINPAGRRVRGDRTAQWPIVEGTTGEPVDLSVVPAPGEPSEMLYLTGFAAGWYEVERPDLRLRIRVEWDCERLPYLWFWQEFGASTEYPWYGRAYVIGLEPFSSYPTSGLATAIANGTALWLEPHEERDLWLRVEVRELV